MVKGYIKLINSKTNEELYCVLDPLTVSEEIYNGIANQNPPVNPNLTVSFYRTNDGFYALRCALQIVSESATPSSAKKETDRLSNKKLNKALAQLNEYVGNASYDVKPKYRKPSYVKAVEEKTDLSSLIDQFTSLIGNIPNETEKEYLKSSFETYLENVNALLKKYKEGKDISSDLTSLTYDTENLIKTINAINTPNKNQMVKIIQNIYSYVEKTVSQKPVEQPVTTPPADVKSLNKLIHSIEKSINKLITTESNAIGRLLAAMDQPAKQQPLEPPTSPTKQQDRKREPSTPEEVYQQLFNVTSNINDAVDSLIEYLEKNELTDEEKETLADVLSQIDNLINKLYTILETNKDIIPADVYAELKPLIDNVDSSMDKLLNATDDELEPALEDFNDAIDNLLNYLNTLMSPPAEETPVEEEPAEEEPEEEDEIADVSAYLLENYTISNSINTILEKGKELLKETKNKTQEDLNKIKGKITVLLYQLRDALNALINELKNMDGLNLENIIGTLSKLIIELNNIISEIANTVNTIPADIAKKIDDIVNKIVAELNKIFQGEDEPEESPEEVEQSAKPSSVFKKIKNKRKSNRKNRRQKMLNLPFSIMKKFNKFNPVNHLLDKTSNLAHTVSNGIEEIGSEINSSTQKLMSVLFKPEPK